MTAIVSPHLFSFTGYVRIGYLQYICFNENLTDVIKQPVANLQKYVLLYIVIS